MILFLAGSHLVFLTAKKTSSAGNIQKFGLSEGSNHTNLKQAPKPVTQHSLGSGTCNISIGERWRGLLPNGLVVSFKALWMEQWPLDFSFWILSGVFP